MAKVLYPVLLGYFSKIWKIVVFTAIESIHLSTEKGAGFHSCLLAYTFKANLKKKC